MPATLELKIDGKVYSDAAIPEAFLAQGTKGIRAFAWDVGSTAAAKQVSKGNEIAGIFVDGNKGRAPDQMKRDIVWEFSIGNSQLIKAVQEALELLRSFSYSFARDPDGDMAGSWDIYINGSKSNIAALENVIPGKDDVRVTSDRAYARFLEAGHWASGTTKVLKREGRRGIRAISKGKQFRKHITTTHEVVRMLRPKYKAVNISDVWYERNPGKGPQGRWPAIVFNKRKRVL